MITRRTDTAENREYWEQLDKRANEVRWRVWWERGEAGPSDRDPVTMITGLDELPPGLRRFTPPEARTGDWEYRVEVKALRKGPR